MSYYRDCMGSEVLKYYARRLDEEGLDRELYDEIMGVLKNNMTEDELYVNGKVAEVGVLNFFDVEFLLKFLYRDEDRDIRCSRQNSHYGVDYYWFFSSVGSPPKSSILIAGRENGFQICKLNPEKEDFSFEARFDYEDFRNLPDVVTYGDRKIEDGDEAIDIELLRFMKDV